MIVRPMRAMSAIALVLAAGAGPVRAGDPVAGKETYDSICVSCHGAGGHATMGYAPRRGPSPPPA